MQSFQRLTAMIFDVIQTFFPAIGLGSNIGLQILRYRLISRFGLLKTVVARFVVGIIFVSITEGCI